MSICRAEQPFEIRPPRTDSTLDSQPESPPLAMETDVSSPDHTPASPSDVTQVSETAAQGPSTLDAQPSTSTGITDGNSLPPLPDYSAAKTGESSTHFIGQSTHLWKDNFDGNFPLYRVD